MRRLRYLVPALAVAAGLLAAPPAAGAQELVITGSHTGWVDVAIPGARDVHLGGATVTMNGRFGGYYAEQLKSNIDPSREGRSTGRIALRHLRADRKPSDTELVGGPSSLTSGVIRFYLVADGPTTVRVQVIGNPLPTARLRPVRRTSASVVATALRRSGDTWAGSIPYRAPGGLAVVGLYAEGSRVDLAQKEYCATDRGAACREGPVLGTGVLDRGQPARPGTTTGDSSAHYWVMSYPKDYDAREARYSISSTPPLVTIARATGVLFVLKLA